jgi:hypothetical protein
LKRLVFLRRLTFVALFSLLINSCTKELSPIGLELLDPLDLLSMGYTDTVQIVAYSIPEDSVFTSNLDYAQVGSMYDPIFGKTTANFYTQLYLTTTRVRFGTDPVFDSAFLYIPYKGSYGDTLSNMTLHVYSLTDSIIKSLDYYSNSTVSYDQANPIGEITFQPKPKDSSYFEGSTHTPYLRIPINSNFGNYVLSAKDTNSLNNSTEFVKFFKGICIIAEPQNTPGKGAIISLSIPSDFSRIVMFYHNTEDTLNYNFAITTDCQRFQHYDHNGYAEAIPMLKEQLQGNTTSGQQFLFAQGMAGIKIKIEFPYLNKWFDTEKVVINDAQLIIGNGSVSDIFTNPSSVTLRGVGEAGSTSPVAIADESDINGYFDGTYNSASNSYRFRIKRYIQQVLTGKANNNGLHLIIPGASYVGSRLVLNGTSSPQSDLKLYLRYTRVQ